MLFAVEGGGFFSSSASGYSKGLTLLLLGQRSEDKPMRVSPWDQYQLVDQESDLDLQLASTKNRISCSCAPFVCFGRTSAGLDAPSIPKVGPVRQQDVQPANVVPENDSKDPNNDSNSTKTALRSSLKKPTNSNSESCEVTDELEGSGKNGSDIPGHTERRKVQWTDACGNDLVEIREFEPSEVGGSDDEFNNGKERSCSCVIM